MAAKKSGGRRAGTPKQVGKRIAPLAGSGSAGSPPSGGSKPGHKSRGFKGSPVVAQNPINVGERATGKAGKGSVFPAVYGAGKSKQITKRPSPPRTRGQSASGAAGAS